MKIKRRGFHRQREQPGSFLYAKDFTTCPLQGHTPTTTLVFYSDSTCNVSAHVPLWTDLRFSSQPGRVRGSRSVHAQKIRRKEKLQQMSALFSDENSGKHNDASSCLSFGFVQSCSSPLLRSESGQAGGAVKRSEVADLKVNVKKVRGKTKLRRPKAGRCSRPQAPLKTTSKLLRVKARNGNKKKQKNQKSVLSAFVLCHHQLPPLHPLHPSTIF